MVRIRGWVRISGMDAITPEDPRDPHHTPLALVAWLASAVGVLAGGLLHLKIWNSDYRMLPGGGVIPGVWVVKVGFPINAGVSVLVAVALAVCAFGLVPAIRRFVIPVALAVEVASLGALIASRQSSIFKWTEKGYDSHAKEVLAVEIVTVLLLIAAAVLPTVLGRGRSANAV
jgi:hypothetical protein